MSPRRLNDINEEDRRGWKYRGWAQNVWSASGTLVAWSWYAQQNEAFLVKRFPDILKTKSLNDKSLCAIATGQRVHLVARRCSRRGGVCITLLQHNSAASRLWYVPTHGAARRAHHRGAHHRAPSTGLRNVDARVILRSSRER